MNNSPLIANWNSKFLLEEVGGLKEKVKGRPPMSKILKIKSVKQESTESRE